jgi:FkbM family methyltransferase
MLEKFVRKIGPHIPDHLYPLIAFPYWTIRGGLFVVPLKNSWYIVRRDGLRFFIPKSGRPESEPYERYFKVDNNETVLDVGACVGEFTIPAAKKAKEVIAVEPDPENVVYLRRNISINGLQNVFIVEKAAWNCRKSLKLYLNECFREHTLVGKPEGRSIEIQADTLDNIVSESGAKRVDFLKMDVEGAELEALEGAEHVLNNVRKIVIETHIRNGRKTTLEVQQFLKSRDFRVHVICRDSVDLVYGWKRG